MSSPTSRSLAHLRKMGFTCEIVERWIPQVNRRRDLFGCADIIAVHPGLPAIVLVQSTSDANVSARVKKCLAEPRLRTWLRAGGSFAVHGWAKSRLREVPITLADTTGIPVEHRPKRRKAKRQEPELFPGQWGLCTAANAPQRHPRASGHAESRPAGRNAPEAAESRPDTEVVL